jgi:hypothetical protein
MIPNLISASIAIRKLNCDMTTFSRDSLLSGISFIRDFDRNYKTFSVHHFPIPVKISFIQVIFIPGL